MSQKQDHAAARVERNPHRQVPVNSVLDNDELLSCSDDKIDENHHSGVIRQAEDDLPPTSAACNQRLHHERVKHLDLTEATLRSHLHSVENIEYTFLERWHTCKTASLKSAAAATCAPPTAEASNSMLASYADCLRNPPNTLELAEIEKAKQILQEDVARATLENQKLRAEYRAQIEYAEKVRSALADQQQTAADQRRLHKIEAREASRNRLKRRVEEFNALSEQEATQRVERQREVIAFVRLHGNYEARVIAARSLRERCKQRDKETDHLRRGYLLRSTPSPVRDVLPSLAKEARLEALVEIDRMQRGKRTEWKNSRVSAPELEAAAHNRAVAEANKVRSARQAERRQQSIIANEECFRLLKSREECQKEHQRALLQRRIDDQAAITATQVQLAERVELRQKLRESVNAAERELAQRTTDLWNSELLSTKAQSQSVALAVRAGQVDKSTQRTMADHQLHDELDRLRTENRMLSCKLWQDKSFLSQQRRNLDLEKNHLERENTVLRMKISSVMVKEAVDVRNAVEDLNAHKRVHIAALREQTTCGDKAVLMCKYGTARQVEQAHATSIVGESEPEATETIVSPAKSPLNQERTFERRPVLLEPSQLPSLVYPTEGAIRQLERVSGVSVPTVSHAKRILQLERELAEMQSPQLLKVEKLSNPATLHRLTQRTVAYDALMLSSVGRTEATNSHSVPKVIGCNSRLYNGVTFGRSSPPPEVNQERTRSPQHRSKSTDVIASHFYSEAIAEHERVLLTARQRALRSTCVSKSPCHPQAFINNTTDRLLFSPIHNQRHTPVEEVAQRIAVDPDKANERFFSAAIAEEREWSKALQKKYNL